MKRTPGTLTLKLMILATIAAYAFAALMLI